MFRNTIRFVAILLPSAVIARPCTPHWSGNFDMLTGEGTTLALHDPDGLGPKPTEVFVGGRYQWYGMGESAFALGTWDGMTLAPAGLGDSVTRALVEHDADGPGPEPSHLYAVIDLYPGVWQGPDPWSQVGGKFKGYAKTLASWDPDGPGPGRPLLIAGGAFTQINGKPVLNIAAWDGAEWLQLGEGLDSTVETVVVLDDDGDGIDTLFAGGWFHASGNTFLGPVARFDGAAWQPLPGTFGQPKHDGPYVRALGVFDDDGDGPQRPRLYATGDFRRIGNTTVNHIARFDGSSWLPLGSGLAAPGGHFLRVLDPDGDGPAMPVLFIGGFFESAGGLDLGSLVTWDGTQWGAPEWSPPNPSGGDDGFWTVNDALYADPDGEGPQPRQLVVVGKLPSYPSVFSPMLSFENGRLRPVGGGICSRASWILFSGVWAMAPWDRDGAGGEPPILAIGGNFPGFLAARELGHTLSLPADLCCIQYDINWVWSPTLVALQAWDDDGPGPRPPGLYATGVMVEGMEGHGIGRLDAGGWTALGDGPDSGIRTMTTFDDDGPGPRPEALYGGGSFASMGGLLVNSIARWDGHDWESLGTGLLNANGEPGYASSLAVFDEDGDGPAVPALFAAGGFQSAGGVEAANIARWDGSTWSEVGGGLSDSVIDLTIFDDDGEGPSGPALIAGGGFRFAGEVIARRLAKWDGESWSEVGGGVGDDSSYVQFLGVVDDDGPGSRPAGLFIAGRFEDVGGAPAHNLARWDGAAWEPLDAPDGFIMAMQPFDDDGDGPLSPALYVAGSFESVAGSPALSLARWGCDAPAPCPADCDATGGLDMLDWMCFVARFNAADPAADCDASGSLDLFDFLCFVNAYNVGC